MLHHPCVCVFKSFPLSISAVERLRKTLRESVGSSEKIRKAQNHCIFSFLVQNPRDPYPTILPAGRQPRADLPGCGSLYKETEADLNDVHLFQNAGEGSSRLLPVDKCGGFGRRQMGQIKLKSDDR